MYGQTSAELLAVALMVVTVFWTLHPVKVEQVVEHCVSVAVELAVEGGQETLHALAVCVMVRDTEDEEEEADDGCDELPSEV